MDLNPKKHDFHKKGKRLTLIRPVGTREQQYLDAECNNSTIKGNWQKKNEDDYED